jgi:hypothetical protein
MRRMRCGWAVPRGLLAIWLRLAVARALLSVALTCQDRFDSLLLTWFQIECVTLNFLNDFLLQNLALESPQRVLQSFTILNVDLSQQSPPYSWQTLKLHANSFPPRGDSIC